MVTVILLDPSTFTLLFCLARLVVITITPLDALAPYIAAAAASFKTLTVSTSYGLMSAIVPSTGKPSTTTKIFEFARSVLTPRNVLTPRYCTKPGTIPSKLAKMFVAFLFSNSALPTVTTDPVELILLIF
ncbi:hypothetical protein D3C86_758000 [compost metagenome]